MLALKCCKCFRLCCPFQDLNEPGWRLCLELSPICAGGLPRRSQGEARVWAGQGGQGALGGGGGELVAVVSPGYECLPPTPKAAGRLCRCRLGMKRDEKFCMAGCGEKQRQSGLVCA